MARYIDITHHLPFGDIVRYERQNRSFNNEYQTERSPSGIIGGYLYERLFLGNPFISSAAEVWQRRSNLTNGNLWSSPGDRDGRLVAYAWDQWMPSWAGSGMWQFRDALAGRKDFAGSDMSFWRTALGTVGSFRTQDLPADVAQRFDKLREQREIRENLGGLRRLGMREAAGQGPPRSGLPFFSHGFDEQREALLEDLSRVVGQRL